MKDNQPQPAASIDDLEIHALIERWAKAVRERDTAGIRANHDADILMFDVPPPFLSRGVDAYMSTWQTFFDYMHQPFTFEFRDVEVTCGLDVGFATARGKCATVDGKNGREPLEFRLTMGLKKIGGQWCVMHEHHSVPAI
jgi:uncharacterized protein (TIGR02246 family)